jgi:hypothetical protein
MSMSSISELGFHVGDIVVWDAGWSMILPHFARIISMTRCTAKAEELSTCAAPADKYGQMGHVVPSSPTGHIITLRTHKNGGLHTQGSSGHSVYKWDGKPAMYDYMD